MKIIVTVLRWFVGLLFIFSGLVKANDPLGLSYKMLEFFEAWNWHWFDNYTLAASIILNICEVLAGIAIIVGWQKKFFTWFLLLLALFFTFLTAEVLFSGKIKECGCFGDCIPLSGWNTFFKDVVLLLFIVIILLGIKHVKPLLTQVLSIFVLLITVVFTLGIQIYVLKSLPFVDCLPYKKGNNIIEEMKIPENAVADSISIMFKYKKNGKIIEFNENNFPADFDSTYEFVDRHDKLIREGNAHPAIADFSLYNLQGNDTTQNVLNQNAVWLMCKDFGTPLPEWLNEDFNKTVSICKQNNLPVYFITALPDKANELFSQKQVTVLKCDATVIKTAARAQPTYFLLNKGTIVSKYSYANAAKFNKELKNFCEKNFQAVK